MERYEQGILPELSACCSGKPGAFSTAVNKAKKVY